MMTRRPMKIPERSFGALRPHGWILAASLAIATWPVSPAAAMVPTTISYQGNLRQNGAPVNTTQTMIFRITDASGGTEYWTSGSLSIPVTLGNFKADLSPTGVAWDAITPYIEVTVSGAVLLPREPLNSVPYALVAGSVPGSVSLASTNTWSAQQTFLNMISVSSDVLMTGALNRTADLSVGGPGYSVTFASSVSAGWFYGDGSALTGINADDKLAKAGDTMTGPLTTTSTITVQGDAFSVGASTFVVTQGNVGIGTTGPGATLEVAGRAILAGDYGVISTTAPAPHTATGVILQARAAKPYIVAQTGTSDAASAFVVYNSAVSPILSARADGNVGIGTTNPGFTLDVIGTFGGTFNGSDNGPLKVGYTASAPAGYYSTYAP